MNGPGTTPGQLFLGPGFAGENFNQCGCTPPDVQVSASSTQVAEMVNLAFAVWSTSGVKLTNSSLYSFYNDNPSTDFLSDPRIIFDPDSGRWFASVLEARSAGHTLAFAVSASGDATGSWTVYRSFAPFGGDLGDQPILGVSHDLLSIGANDYGGTGFDGAQFWVVNKSAVLNGTAAAFASFGPYPMAFSIHPVRAVEPANGMFLVETFAGSPGAIELFSVSGVPPTVPSVQTTNLTVGNIVAPVAAAQPGTVSKLDDQTHHVQDALWSGGHLWLASSDTCATQATNHSCVRIDEINTTGTPTVYQDFDIAVNGTDLLYPSISLDNSGSLVVVFGLSSATRYPSIAATYRTLTDPIGTVRPGTLVRGGSASILCGGTCRFGDYFGSGIQPGSSNVWVAGEYITPSTSWETWIEAVRGGGPMAVTTQLARPSVDVGQPLGVNVTLANSTCLSGGPARCSLQIPFGDGTTAWLNCSTPNGTLSFHHRFASAGTFSVGLGGAVLVFTSGNCGAGVADSTIPLTPQTLSVLPALSSGLNATPTNGSDVGQRVQFSVVTASGLAPYSYVWTGLPPSCSGSDLATLSCSPTTAGDYSIVAATTDSNGVVVNASLSYRVDNGPSVTLAASQHLIEVGQSVQFIATAVNGSGAYHFDWQGLPAGCVPADASSLVCAPTQAAVFHPTVRVNDSRGAISPADSLTLTVVAALGVSISGPSGPVTPGASVTFDSTVVGGNGSITYAWSGLPAGCTDRQSPTITCHPSAGDYSLTVIVRDGLGGTATATFHLVAASGWLGLSVLTFGIAALLLVVLVAIVTVLVLRQRRREREPVPRPKPPQRVR